MSATIGLWYVTNVPSVNAWTELWLSFSSLFTKKFPLYMPLTLCHEIFLNYISKTSGWYCRITDIFSFLSIALQYLSLFHYCTFSKVSCGHIGTVVAPSHAHCVHNATSKQKNKQKAHYLSSELACWLSCWSKTAYLVSPAWTVRRAMFQYIMDHLDPVRVQSEWHVSSVVQKWLLTCILWN